MGYTFHGHVITLSFLLYQLSCKVDTYFLTSPGRKGPGIPSNGYWMGIKV